MTSTPELIETGDFVSFVEYSWSETGSGMDKFTASGYVTRILDTGHLVVEFNDRNYEVDPAVCSIICKQYKLPGF